MATGRRRRRSSNKPNNKRKPRREAAAAGPTTVHDVPDHVLELILLCLHSSACLLRAAATCKWWRRLVADTGFLSRFGRSLTSRPCIVGNYHAVDPDPVEFGRGQPPEISGSSHPVFLPSSSPEIVDRRRFSLDFLPGSDIGWEIVDSHGSLLLLTRRSPTWSWALRDRRQRPWEVPDLVVCEPLTRRYQGILRPTNIIRRCLGVFLLDSARTSGSRIGMSNFRIVCVLHEWAASEQPVGTPAACVLSFGCDEEECGWRVLRPKTDVSIPNPYAINSICFVGRANGSIYWVITGEDGRDMLALDEATMEFSRFLFPADDVIPWGPCVDRSSFRIVGGEDGALRVIRVVGDDLKVFVQRGSGEWVLEKLVWIWEAAHGLPGVGHEWSNFRVHLDPMIIEATGKFVLVTPQGKTWPFSIELETLKAEREHERNKYPGTVFPCELPWPPVLNVCVDRGRRRRR